MVDCYASFLLRNQSDVDDFISDCASAVKIPATLNIQNYTETSLTFNATNTFFVPSLGFNATNTIYINYDISVVGSSTLQTIHTGSLLSVGITLSSSEEQITGRLSLEDLPNLSQVDGDLDLVGGVTLRNLPKLSSLSPGDYSLVSNSTVVVESTGLSQIVFQAAGVTSSIANKNSDIFTGLAGVNISNNDNLSQILFDPLINGFTGPVVIHGTDQVLPPPAGTGLNLSLTGITTAKDISISYLGNLSLPVITQLSSFTVQNGSVTSIQLPSLATIESNLTLGGLGSLSQLNLNTLKSIGGSLQITGPSNLKNVNQMAALEVVNGSIHMEGPLSSVGFPSLRYVGQRMTINSSADLDCSTVNFTHLGVVDKDHSTCISSTRPTTTANGLTTTTSSTAPVKSSHLGAILGGVIGSLLFVALLLVAGWMVWKQKEKKEKKEEEEEEEEERRKRSVYFGRVELEQKSGPVSSMVEVPEQCIQELDTAGSGLGFVRPVQELEVRPAWYQKPVELES